ncbi:MAG: FHA domain-containing protein, partial [Pyrinomonadaceae bacterium]
ERAKEIAGKRKLETRSFVIELRIDGTLEKGEIQVKHGWEDSTGNKTGVLARPKAMPPTQTVVTASALPTDPSIGSTARAAQFQTPSNFPNANIQQAVPLATEDAEEMTAVKSRMTELYKLEVWRSGMRQNVVPIFQKEIVIGRGSKSQPVDIPLSGDVEISRRHLTLVTDGIGNFWAVNEGKNPAAINNYDLPAGQRVLVNIGVPLNICSYMLRVQPR